jgi:AraC family transcriptional regulator, regulatory protein of adaptative response / methylated-DNA-[protein]-cysteine methyltransferase
LRGIFEVAFRRRLEGGGKGFEELVTKVVTAIETPSLPLDLPLDVRGTVFQQRVWQALRDIPAGSTATYAEVARRIGAPKAARAVAKACATT